jgi:tight adherence protein C
MDSLSLILVLVFAAILLFILALYFLQKAREERQQLIQRLDQDQEESLLVKKNGEAPRKAKAGFLKLLSSLSAFARPKKEEEVSLLRKKFLKAGLRTEKAPVFFWGAKVFSALALLVLLILVNLFFIHTLVTFRFVFLAVIAALIGLYLPDLWLWLRIKDRREKMFNGLPDALDMLVVCTEAGMGLDAAISRVGEEIRLSNQVLSDELKQVTLELRAGKHRQEALRNLSQRTELEDLNSLVSLLVQTDKFGTSVAQALRVYSDSMRTKRFQKAEEIAAKISVKLTFPLILFIFPALFVVIMGPALIQVYRIIIKG